MDGLLMITWRWSGGWGSSLPFPATFSGWSRRLSASRGSAAQCWSSVLANELSLCCRGQWRAMTGCGWWIGCAYFRLRLNPWCVFWGCRIADCFGFVLSGRGIWWDLPRRCWSSCIGSWREKRICFWICRGSLIGLSFFYRCRRWVCPLFFCSGSCSFYQGLRNSLRNENRYHWCIYQSASQRFTRVFIEFFIFFPYELSEFLPFSSE